MKRDGSGEDLVTQELPVVTECLIIQVNNKEYGAKESYQTS